MDGNTNGNGKKAWGTIQPMVAEDIPPSNASMWWDLFLEVRTELASSPTGAVRVPFTDMKLAKSAQTSLRNIFRDRDPAVTVTVREAKLGADLFVYRPLPAGPEAA